MTSACSQPSRPDPGFYSPAQLQPEDSVGSRMRKVMASIRTQADARFASHDLTYAQWLPLFKLSHCTTATVASLARDLESDPALITRTLDRLEAKGLCRRVRSEHDRRVVHIELTPAGEDVARRVPHILSRVYNDVLAGFSADEWQQLQDFLRRLRANAESASTHSREESA